MNLSIITLCNVARPGRGGDCGLVDARVAGDRLVGDGGRDGGARVLRRVAIAVAAVPNKRWNMLEMVQQLAINLKLIYYVGDQLGCTVRL